MEFLYLFCGFDDQRFLHEEHKLKKLKQQCQVIYEKLANPDYEQLELEKTLRSCALLQVQEEPGDVSDKKTEGGSFACLCQQLPVALL